MYNEPPGAGIKGAGSAPEADLRNGPDANGLFGAFGGRFVAETLMPLILDLDREYELAKKDPEFIKELADFQRDRVKAYHFAASNR